MKKNLNARTESIFHGFDFKKPGGNSNFRLLKELLLASENLETKVTKVNQDLLELQQCVSEVKQKVLR